MGAVFHFDEVFGAEDFLEGFAAEVGNGEDLFGLETGLREDVFNVFWVIVIKTVFANLFVVGDFFVPRVDLRTTGDETSHFRKSTFVGDFDNCDTTGFENAVEFCHGFVHMLEVMGDANHHEAV